MEEESDLSLSDSTLSGAIWDRDMFKFLLCYPYSRDAYENFLAKEYADENVQFWAACEVLQKQSLDMLSKYASLLQAKKSGLYDANSLSNMSLNLHYENKIHMVHSNENYADGKRIGKASSIGDLSQNFSNEQRKGLFRCPSDHMDDAQQASILPGKPLHESVLTSSSGQLLNNTALNDVRYYLNSSKPVSSCASSSDRINGNSNSSLDNDDKTLEGGMKNLNIKHDEVSKRGSLTSVGADSALHSSWSSAMDWNESLPGFNDHATDPFTILKTIQDIYQAFIKVGAYRQVNIDSTIRRDTATKIKRFVEALQVVFPEHILKLLVLDNSQLLDIIEQDSVADEKYEHETFETPPQSSYTVEGSALRNIKFEIMWEEPEEAESTYNENFNVVYQGDEPTTVQASWRVIEKFSQLFSSDTSLFNCFESAQMKIFSLMYNDSFPRFMLSLDEVVTPPSTRKALRRSQTSPSTQFTVNHPSTKCEGLGMDGPMEDQESLNKIKEFFYMKQLHSSASDLTKERPCNEGFFQSYNGLSKFSLESSESMLSPVTDRKIASVIAKFKAEAKKKDGSTSSLNAKATKLAQGIKGFLKRKTRSWRKSKSSSQTQSMRSFITEPQTTGAAHKSEQELYKGKGTEKAKEAKSESRFSRIKGSLSSLTSPTSRNSKDTTIHKTDSPSLLV
eukprot:Nk52_evm133s226 gene=Nk52_evmTU133s226